MTINLLDEHLINKIAAGEVIERPASVVKELVDNALDAGASRIEISFTQGGIEIIEVEDNGQGIDEKDLPQAFMRHATSKITAENDLYNITTMGFRGEALPSIASVSRVDIFTCRPDQTGVYACYEGGLLQSLEPASCPPGTRVRVGNLFYNTPARRKFLKSPVSEGNHIHELVSRYALAWPEVSFTLRSNRKTYFKTPGNGSIRDAAVAVYGAEFVKTLLDISYQGELFALQGMISPPETTRQNRRGQLFFVNKRPIRSSLLYRAIDVAYQGLLLSREYPIVILNISVPGNLVDVNVHPQKWEVRFADEKQVFSLIRQVIVDHLSRHDRSALAGIHQVSYPPPLSRPSYNQVDYETGELLLNETNGASLDYREPLPTFSVDNRPGFSSEARVLGQLMKSYILVEIEEGLWIIDQHAAHERILFNRLKQENQQAITGHELLFPVSLEISTRQVELLEREKERMEQIGFSYDRAGLSSVIIRRAPSQIKGQEPQVLMDLIELLDNGNYKDFREEAMISMACHKAIKAGDFMSASEMQILINDLLVQEQYQHCPHGRPTLMKIGHHDLEKVFKRA
jgi:DNA mismatch repair protein MutL